MTTDRDVDRITAAFLRDGPAELSDRVLDDAFSEIHLTRQRRRPAVPWRNGPMSSFSLRIAAVVAVVALGGAALAVWSGSQGIALRASPAPSTVAQPTAAPPTAAATQPSAATASAATALMAPLGYQGTGTIAFTRDDPTLGGLAPFLIDPSGANETRVNIQHGWANARSVPQTGCCVAFSPDGTRFTVGYDEDNPARGPGILMAGQVFGLDNASTSMVPVVCGACAMIDGVNLVPHAWSRTGDLQAVEVWSDADPTKNGIDIFSTDSANGPDAIQVTGAHRDVPMTFSPDGSKLLFVRLRPDADSGDLFVLGLTTRKVRQVNQPGTQVFVNGYFGNGASWSPDGARIAFSATDASGDAEQMSVYVVDATGGTPTKLAGPSGFVTSAQWSPDGSWIAFDWNTGSGTHDLHIVHAGGTGERNLTDRFAPGVCCMRWSPDGSALLAAATLGPNDRSDLVIVPVNGDPIRQVTRMPAQYADYSWGPATR